MNILSSHGRLALAYARVDFFGAVLMPRFFRGDSQPSGSPPQSNGDQPALLPLKPQELSIYFGQQWFGEQKSTDYFLWRESTRLITVLGEFHRAVGKWRLKLNSPTPA